MFWGGALVDDKEESLLAAYVRVCVRGLSVKGQFTGPGRVRRYFAELRPLGRGIEAGGAAGAAPGSSLHDASVGRSDTDWTRLLRAECEGASRGDV